VCGIWFITVIFCQSPESCAKKRVRCDITNLSFLRRHLGVVWFNWRFPLTRLIQKARAIKLHRFHPDKKGHCSGRYLELCFLCSTKHLAARIAFRLIGVPNSERKRKTCFVCAKWLSCLRAFDRYLTRAWNLILKTASLSSSLLLGGWCLWSTTLLEYYHGWPGVLLMVLCLVLFLLL